MCNPDINRLFCDINYFVLPNNYDVKINDTAKISVFSNYRLRVNLLMLSCSLGSGDTTERAVPLRMLQGM